MELKPAALYLDVISDLSPVLNELTSLCGKGVYPVGIGTKEYAALSLSNAILKKFKGSKSLAADGLALDKFLSSDALCARWECVAENPFDELLLNGFKDRLWKFFQTGGFQAEFGPEQIVKNGRLGAGSNLKARGNDFYTKLFDSPLSSTSDRLYRTYRRYTNTHRLFEAAEMQRLRWFDSVSIVDGNRLGFVPKTTDISRTIATEPTLNMWFQLACGDALNRLLVKKMGIDISIQPELNREMARLGSMDGTYCTIDLESASDSVSSKMLQWALPAEVFRDLSLYRSPVCTLPDGTKHRLEMFSSMGNGFTFSLQTVIFSCVVCTVYHLCGHQIIKATDRPGNFGVFGDDIVCFASCARQVTRLLNLLGFRVNVHKSFSEGPFRESCGSDFLSGVNVRGVYLKDTSEPSIYSAINLLQDFSARHGIHLKRTLTYLRKFVRYVPVPLWDNLDSGIRTPLSFFRPKVNKNLSFAYYGLRVVPKVLRFSEDAVRTPRCERRKRHYNAAAVELCFLAGHLMSGCIPIRHDRPRYRLKLLVAPNWDFNPTWATMASSQEDTWKRWNTAFYANM
jgi:hypothetical protein